MGVKTYKLTKEQQTEIDQMQDRYGGCCSPAVVSVICEHLIGAYITEAYCVELNENKILTVEVSIGETILIYNLTYTEDYKTVFSITYK